jgi:hypothetical protein
VNIASGACNNKVMQLAVVGTMAGSPIQASWTLASSALTTAIYQLGATGNGSVSGVYHNASTPLAPFDIATLSTVALSIS